MIPDDQLTWAAVGCRGFLRLCLRAGYYRFCEIASVPFLRVYQAGYGLLLHLVIYRMSSMRGHDLMVAWMGFMDDYCPTWVLTLVHDVSLGDYHRRGRLIREANDAQLADIERLGQ